MSRQHQHIKFRILRALREHNDKYGKATYQDISDATMNDGYGEKPVIVSTIAKYIREYCDLLVTRVENQPRTIQITARGKNWVDAVEHAIQIERQHESTD